MEKNVSFCIRIIDEATQKINLAEFDASTCVDESSMERGEPSALGIGSGIGDPYPRHPQRES
jgi:hypothetical protein